jgi:uncharacterized protein
MNSHTFPAPIPVIDRDVQTRSLFITRTYSHLLGALTCFTLLEIFFFKSGLAEPMANAMLGTSWLLVLGAFLVVSWLARSAAHRAQSFAAQYAALGAYIVGQAIIFVPLLHLADRLAPGAIASAAFVTALAFTGLTAVAFITRKDFSFLRGMLFWGGILALVLIVAGVIFGFELGTFFSVAMVGLAGAAILYDTSNVLHHYPEDRYVAAALELFASFALMLWYVLRIFMSRR